MWFFVFFFKQKTAYELRISDWSSDVCSSDLAELADHVLASAGIAEAAAEGFSATLVGAARSRIGDAADAAITISHQVHGAIGFSREYALNYRTRRQIGREPV